MVGLRQDRPATANAVFLHQDRQDVALLIEIGELPAEAKEGIIRGGR
jgi:hypothetical protein